MLVMKGELVVVGWWVVEVGEVGGWRLKKRGKEGEAKEEEEGRKEVEKA